MNITTNINSLIVFSFKNLLTLCESIKISPQYCCCWTLVFTQMCLLFFLWMGTHLCVEPKVTTLYKIWVICYYQRSGQPACCLSPSLPPFSVCKDCESCLLSSRYQKLFFFVLGIRKPTCVIAQPKELFVLVACCLAGQLENGLLFRSSLAKDSVL